MPKKKASTAVPVIGDLNISQERLEAFSDWIAEKIADEILAERTSDACPSPTEDQDDKPQSQSPSEKEPAAPETDEPEHQ